VTKDEGPADGCTPSVQTGDIMAGRDVYLNFGMIANNSFYSIYACKNQIDIISSKIISAELSFDELIELKIKVVDPYLEQRRKERGEKNGKK
jgi:hypothetical protein